jgi:hypothetical protein
MKLKLEPVRIYAVAVAVLAVVAYYVPNIPTVLYLGVVAAVLGLGESVRAVVTPNSRVVVGVADIPDGGDVIVYGPDLGDDDHEA